VASQPLPPNSGAVPPPPVGDPRSLYSTPAEATKAIQERFNYWTGKLNDISLQLSFAVIGANWAVFKTSDGAIRNGWSRLSIAIAIVGIGANLVATWWVGNELGRQADYAESDLGRWESEYRSNTGKQTEWPYTGQMVAVAKRARLIRIWIPISAGCVLLIGLLRV
jgi:hypothetical protein